MNRVSVSGVPQVADAFTGNQLLSTLEPALRDMLGAQVELLRLDEGDTVLRPGQPVTRSIFPFGRTTVSLVVDVDDRKGVEVASIGREGAVGGIVSCGDVPAFSRAEVIVGGYAASVPLSVLEKLKSDSGHLKNLFCRFADYLLGQIMQSAACNSFHSIEARTARWLLTADDRAGPQLELTQEALARLLGAQRTTINAVIGAFEHGGFLRRYLAAAPRHVGGIVLLPREEDAGQVRPFRAQQHGAQRAVDLAIAAHVMVSGSDAAGASFMVS